jgi:hypothetical protein
MTGDTGMSFIWKKHISPIDAIARGIDLVRKGFGIIPIILTPDEIVEKVRKNNDIKPDWCCEECGSTGEDGAIEYSDGKIYHFRKPWPKDGTIRPIMCCGKFVKALRRERRGDAI